MADDQLLLRTFFQSDILSAGHAIRIRFNLQSGYIARVLGFHIQLRDVNAVPALVRSLSIHFRTSPDAPLEANPTDLLWSTQYEKDTESAVGFQSDFISKSYNLPKPYRTPAIMVQLVSNVDEAWDVFGIVYYDVSPMTKDEDVQYLESTRQRGISRVA